MSVSSLNLNHRFTAFLATFVFIVLISILRYESPSYLVVILYATLYGMLMSISFGRNHDSRNAKSFIFITLSTLLLWKVFIVFFSKIPSH
jgi:heme O synthase-like polyprenyltransferase